MKTLKILYLFLATFLGLTQLGAVPYLITYQGRVVADGVNYTGEGQFKFALLSAEGATTYWSNDGTSVAGSPPIQAVSLGVDKGYYAVMLGDTTLANMTMLTPAMLQQTGDVFLRVWFNDGSHGFEQLTPDQRLGAVPYALVAESVRDGGITVNSISDATAVGRALLMQTSAGDLRTTIGLDNVSNTSDADKPVSTAQAAADIAVQAASQVMLNRKTLVGDGRLLRFFDDVRNVYNSTPSTARVSILIVGDSLAGRVASNITRRVREATNYRFGGIAVGYVFSSGATSGALDYEIWPTGDYVSIPESGVWSTNGPAPASERLIAYTVRRPNGGTLVLETSTNGSTWTTEATIDTNGAIEGVVTAITKPRNRYWIRLRGTAGVSYAVVGLGFDSTSGRGYFEASIAKGGLNIANMAQTPASIVRPIVASWNPSLITFQMDDSAALMQANFQTLKNNISGVANSSWLVFGNGPKAASAGGDSASQAQCDYFRENMEGLGIAFYDLMALGRSYAELVALGMNGDGLHLGQNFYDAAGSNVMQNMAGIDLYMRSTNEIATTAARVRSLALARSSSTENDIINPDSAAIFFTDSSFGLDAYLDLTRGFFIRAGIVTPTNLAVFSANEGVFAHQLMPRFHIPNMNGSLPSPYTTLTSGGVLYVSGNELNFRNASTGAVSVLKQQLTATAALDFPSISSGLSADRTITVTGALAGQSVSAGLPAAPAAGIVFNAFVSAPDTVTIRASNISGSAIDPASATYRATVFAP